MGEERAEASPFRFFADFEDEHLRRAVDQGRANEYPHHEWAGAVSPTEKRAFQESKLHRSDDPTMFAWYQSLLKLRRAWVKQGVLNPQYLSTIWDAESHLFGLKYAGPDKSECFVLSRLYPVKETPPPVRISIDGELLLDSDSENPPDCAGPIEMNTPRALIGRGSFEVLHPKPASESDRQKEASPGNRPRRHLG